MLNVTRNYLFTPKALNDKTEDYTAQKFAREIEWMNSYNSWNADCPTDLYVTDYFVGNVLKGITVSADSEDTIEWFIHNWIKWGYYTPVDE